MLPAFFMSISEKEDPEIILTSYLKNRNVRYILQSIYDQVMARKKSEKLILPRSKVKITLRVKSEGEDVQFLDLGDSVINASNFTDRLFLQWLQETKIVSTIEYAWISPNNKEGIVTEKEKLQIFESWRFYEYLISFNIEDENAFKEIYNFAVDALVENPYSTQDQENILYADILNTKSLAKQNTIIITRNEINQKDLPHIKVLETLKSLEKLKKIVITDIKFDFVETNDYGNPFFKAKIVCLESLPFAVGHNCLSYRSFTLDLDSKRAIYIRAKHRNIVYSPKEKRRYSILEAFLTEQSEPRKLNEVNVYNSLSPSNKKVKKLTPEQRKKNKWALNYLKRKFDNKSLFKKFGVNSWEFNP